MKKIITIAFGLFLLSTQLFSEELITGVEPELPEYVFGFNSSTFNAKYLSSANSGTALSQLGRNFEEIKQYPLTPGDVFTLSMVSGIANVGGSSSGSSYTIQLKQDYTLEVPLIGEIDTRGKNILELEGLISEKIKKVMPVQFVKFTLTAPASFDIFVYGSVNSPGSILATPITTLTDAIAARGGFTARASYRNIILKRNGQEEHIDISKYYNMADASSNPRLKPGDEIYIPMAEKMVVVKGMIQFPGQYELVKEDSLESLLRLCGGIVKNPGKSLIEITRMDKSGKTERISADIKLAADFKLENGDNVELLLPSHSAETITVEGALYGKSIQVKDPFTAPISSIKLEIPYYPGISLLNVLDALGGPTPYAKTELTEIRREDAVEPICLDIEPLWESRNTQIDIELFPGDHVFVPIEEDFVAVFGALLDDEASNILQHRTGYTVMDYIVRAGGIDYQIADTNNIQLIARDGSRTKIELTDAVPPGTMIYVSKNILQNTNDVWNNVLIITSIVTGITTFVTTLVTFIFNVRDWTSTDATRGGFTFSF